jgi:hypothetical protein
MSYSKKTPKYICEVCDFKCMRNAEYVRHISTRKHEIRTGVSLQKPPTKSLYICDICDVTCSSQCVYNRHISTTRHIFRTENMENTKSNDGKYICKCGNSYASRSALWYHKKRCPNNNNIVTSEKVNRVLPISQTFTTEHDHVDMADTIQAMVNAKVEEQLAKMGDPNIAMFLEAQAAREEAREEAAAAREEARDAAAAEQTRLLIETISLNGPQCITNNTTNNNQFNLNVFLNEDCKDAFTLKEVMETIECTVADLDRMDTDGYAATITRKILESMQHMSITERPIHCTDARRNTVCVKDETGWEKNEKAMKLLVDSVYRVGCKLGRMVDDWRVAYPDHFRGTVSRREQYHRLVMDILKVSDLDVEGRIASKVCKGIVLDRNAVKN